MKNLSQEEVSAIGNELIRRIRQEENAASKSDLLQDTLFDWCMSHDELKKSVFCFIDLFPQLQDKSSLIKHIREYFPPTLPRLPRSVQAALFFAKSRVLTKNITAFATQKMFQLIAKKFIGASTLDDALLKFMDYDKKGFTLSMDLLGEKVLSAEEAKTYTNRYLELIEKIGRATDAAGKKNISVKMSALDPRFDPIDPDGSSARVIKNLAPILESAQKYGVQIQIDMEEYATRNLTFLIIKRLLADAAFKNLPGFGCVLQSYLIDSDDFLDRICALADTLSFPLTVRLVRGAYFDYELFRSAKLRQMSPVFTVKEQTDHMYENLTARILTGKPNIHLALATHNIRSLAYGIALAQKLNRASAFEVQLLYGIGSLIGNALKTMNQTPRFYMPVGDPLWGMSYLVRRLLENASNESFLRRHLPDITFEELLRVPLARNKSDSVPKPAAWGQKTHPWQKTTFLPFHDSNVCVKYSQALDRIREQFGKTLPLLIGGKSIYTEKTLDSVSPNDGKTIIAKMSVADQNHAEDALNIAEKSFGDWNALDFGKRAELLKKAAHLMRQNRYEMAAVVTHEVGKPWREADADIVEAIDFCEYYAHLAVQWDRDTATETLGDELNFTRMRARGAAVIIAPWNFPVAILTGMSAAAIITGNPVIIKPAEQSPLAAWYVINAFLDAGIPSGIVQFLTGKGEIVGRELVRNPKTALIAFTGSKSVGLEIASSANAATSTQQGIKKIIIETGGKNACIIDESADFDEAIPACLQSAFGFSGQKCSALSRLIILDSVYDRFAGRLAKSAELYPCMSALHPDALCGPLIDKDAFMKVSRYIADGKKAGRVVFEGRGEENSPGFYIPPVIFDQLPDDSPLLHEEIFGPVLCLVRAKNFDEALVIANDSDFALTGGIFSRTPSHIALAKKSFEAGNLYINRSITGAVVMRQPFGGYRLSGTGTKAGGKHYLREFMIERTISENTYRHGYAPE